MNKTQKATLATCAAAILCAVAFAPTANAGSLDDAKFCITAVNENDSRFTSTTGNCTGEDTVQAESVILMDTSLIVDVNHTEISRAVWNDGKSYVWDPDGTPTDAPEHLGTYTNGLPEFMRLGDPDEASRHDADGLYYRPIYCAIDECYVNVKIKDGEGATLYSYTAVFAKDEQMFDPDLIASFSLDPNQATFRKSLNGTRTETELRDYLSTQLTASNLTGTVTYSGKDAGHVKEYGNVGFEFTEHEPADLSFEVIEGTPTLRGTLLLTDWNN